MKTTTNRMGFGTREQAVAAAVARGSAAPGAVRLSDGSWGGALARTIRGTVRGLDIALPRRRTMYAPAGRFEVVS
jgi:hypothetical protein